jgi:hypothetical protein
MNSSQKGGKSKSSKSSSSKSKKGGNFLGSVSELFVPTGWESFATAAGLLAIDRADAAFRRSRNSSKKQKGGSDLVEGHESIQTMEKIMESLGNNGPMGTGPMGTDPMGTDSFMSGGGKKKSTAKKSTAKKSTAKKSTTKTAKKPAKKAKKPTKK